MKMTPINNREYTSLTEKVIWETEADTSAHFCVTVMAKAVIGCHTDSCKKAKVIGAARTWPWICHVPKLN